MRRSAALVALLLLTPSAAAAAAPARSAILVHLPGATGAELAELVRAGALDGGGFAPFFAAGEVGPGLLPAEPTLPIAAALALSTGAPPGVFGAVAELVRRPGGSLADRVAPAAVPAESLWSAAARQGLAVGAVLWPGVDNRSAAGRATWGLADRETTRYRPSGMRLERRNWVDKEARRSGGWRLPAGVASYSKPLALTVPVAAEHERVEIFYDLVAIDRSDDGRENYDGVLVSSRIDPSRGAVGVAEVGAWFRIDLPAATGTTRQALEAIWLKVIALAPDLSDARIYVSGSATARAYPAALQRRLDEARLTWPGRPDEAAWAAAEVSGVLDAETFVEMAGRLAAHAVDVALAGRALFPTDLELVTIPVFDAVDRWLPPGREPEPAESAEDFALRAAARRQLWRALDRELARLLAAVDRSTTTLVLVSGYANVAAPAQVDVREALRQAPATAALVADPAARRLAVVPAGGVAHIYLAVAGRDPDGVVPRSEAAATARAIRDALRATRDGDREIFARVLLRAEARSLGLDRPESGDVIAWARPGYQLRETPSLLVVTRAAGPRSAAGYAAADPASQGLWLALGPGIAPRTLPRPLAATEVAGRVARALGIDPPRSGR